MSPHFPSPCLISSLADSAAQRTGKQAFSGASVWDMPCRIALCSSPNHASDLPTMTITTSVYIATSLDGFIAREDGSIDWLSQANTAVPPGEDCGYAAFMGSVDVVVMGRNTYEQVAAFEPWPYAGKRVVVLTSRLIDFRKGPEIQLEQSAELPQALLKRLASEGCKHAYVDGGKVIQNFLSHGLIDALTVTTVPILIGGGRPLFGRLPGDVRWTVARSKAYEFGFVQTTYLVRAGN